MGRGGKVSLNSDEIYEGYYPEDDDEEYDDEVFNEKK